MSDDERNLQALLLDGAASGLGSELLPEYFDMLLSAVSLSGCRGSR